MEQSFKRIADSVCLSESSRTRIRAQIAFRAEEQEASMQNNSKKHLPRLAVAAITLRPALTLTAAARRLSTGSGTISLSPASTNFRNRQRIHRWPWLL